MDPEVIGRRAAVRRLVIADDHALVRSGIRSMLTGEGDLEIVAEAEDGHQAVKLCRSLRPDLVLMDVRMPGMDGLEATRHIKAHNPKTAVLVVTTHDSADYLLEAIKGGAAGYVLKESTRDEFLGAVRSVLAGDSPLDQGVAMRLLRRLADDNPQDGREGQRDAHPQDRGAGPHVWFDTPTPPPDCPLTPRELDVLRPLCEGATNRQIAALLHLSLSTVKGHVERITGKLEVSDRTQAAVRAVKLGLVRTGGSETRNPG